MLACPLWAQADKITDSILEESASLIYSDIAKAEKQALFLVQNQTQNENAVMALLVLADAAYLKADFEATIEHLTAAGNSRVAHSSETAIWRDLYFAHYYRLFGFSELAQQHQSQALKQLQQFSKDALHSKLWARYFLEASESRPANALRLHELEKALNEANRMGNASKHALHYQIEIALAKYYLQMNRLSDAIRLLKPMMEEPTPNVFKARALLELALAGKAAGNSRQEHLLEACRLLETGTDLPTKKIVCQEIADHLLKSNQIPEYKIYFGKYQQLEAQIKHNTKMARDSVIKNLEQSKSKKAQSNWYYFSAVVVLLLLLLYGIYSYLKTRQDYQKFLKAVEKPSAVESIPAKPMAIPQKTEQALLEKLSKFEKSNKFTNANLTINTLAKSLDTNTKYLSEIINRNKNANFNQYLNELRVNYIIAKMKEDPKYLNYKIYYLAKESGFSSQSTFSTVFRASTGISPLSFIKFLKHETKTV